MRSESDWEARRTKFEEAQYAYKVLHGFGDSLSKQPKDDAPSFTSFDLHIKKDLVGNRLAEQGLCKSRAQPME
jgi:hypothetical protein